MSSPNPLSGYNTDVTRQAGQFVRGYVGQMGGIAEHAVSTDEAGHWGLDAWIRLIHNLIDLQIRTSATAFQAAIAGPWWLQPVDREPWLSDEIEVEDKPYPRVFTIVRSFQQLGRQDVTIPDTAITFVPNVLPANAKKFQIDLTDNNFVGANYVGKVVLRRADGSASRPPRPDPISVTVGL